MEPPAAAAAPLPCSDPNRVPQSRPLRPVLPSVETRYPWEAFQKFGSRARMAAACWRYQAAAPGSFRRVASAAPSVRARCFANGCQPPRGRTPEEGRGVKQPGP